MPQSTTDIQFYFEDSILVHTSVISYVISDEEELEEMAYVEEHYLEMNYEEILSMTDHKFGFYNSYGAKVKDYTNMKYTLAVFHMNDCFKSVEEGSIENYTILDYYPTLIGSRISGLIVDEENRKFIAFYISKIK